MIKQFRGADDVDGAIFRCFNADRRCGVFRRRSFVNGEIKQSGGA
jgi:hypothetical protein